MKCEKCGVLLDEGVTLCPECCAEIAVAEEVAVEGIAPVTEETTVCVEGETTETQTEESSVEENEIEEAGDKDAEEAAPVKVKTAWWKLVLLGVGVLAAVILFVALILKDQGIDPNPAHWFGSSAAVRDSEYPLTRKSYTASEKNIDKQIAAVVAENGDLQMTNGQLQILYWTGVYEFINQYQYYLESMGLDIYQPLDEQNSAEGVTWQQFFLENAFYNWHKYSALVQQAKKDGHELSEAQQKQLDELAANMESMAQTNGFTSVVQMIQKELGPLCDMDSYMDYMETYTLAVDYFNTQYENMKPTDEQVEAYFTANEQALAQQGITKESKLYNVRHILIEPEGGTEDENGQKTYTDEQWQACLQKAQQMLDTWLAEDGTEDGFAQLAKDNSADGGSSTNGGLYEGLSESTNFVQEFKDWYLDKDRKVGDTGLVKSVYGYHIMYFSAAETNWYSECYNALMMEMSEQFVQECMAAWPITMNDRKVAIGTVTFEQQ